MCKIVEDIAADERAKGEAKGEVKKSKETAIKMLNDNMPIDLIVKYSGLTLEQVQELAKNI